MKKLFSLIYKGDIHLPDKGKVLSKEAYSALLESVEVLEKAKEEVALYRKEAEDAANALKEQKEKEGFEEGLSRFNEHILQLDGTVKQLRQEMQKSILPLALKAAKKIVNKELETAPETIVDIVMQVLLPVTQSKEITIFVNKTDREILEENKPKIKNLFDQVESLSIQDRADVAPGGCMIKTESGIINAELEGQWRALEAAFEKFMRNTQ